MENDGEVDDLILNVNMDNPRKKKMKGRIIGRKVIEETEKDEEMEKTLLDISKYLKGGRELLGGKQKDHKDHEKEPRFCHHQMETFSSLEKSITDFISKSTEEKFQFPPMNRKNRYLLHHIAELYNLSTQSFGRGKSRFTILFRGPNTTIQPNEEKRNGLISQMQEGNALKSFQVQDGEIVGGSAKPLDEENVGNRLLRAMGWKGGALGSNTEASHEPVTVVVRKGKRGLGFEKQSNPRRRKRFKKL